MKDKKRVEEVIKTKKALVEKYGISPVLIETLYTNMIVLLSGKKRKNGKSDSIKFYRRYIPGFYEY